MSKGDPVIEEELNGAGAQDAVIFSTPSNPSLATPELSALSENIALDGITDPITEAIRKEILEKQREELRKTVINQNPNLAGEIDNDAKFREFLNNLREDEERRRIINEALKDRDLKGKLENIELAGYKNVHETFKDRFQNVPWDGPAGTDANQNTTKSQKVTNGQGAEICTLTETTHKADLKVSILKEDGTSAIVNINSYRTIDFPIKLDEKNANDNMHLSMVALDKNGQRPPEGQAVFFTAHYEQGKLREVSSPMPIKFNGTDKDAVGFFEHGGKVYTLPVTRGKYEEMMQEVAINKGQGINASQTMEAPAADRIVSQELSAPANTLVNEYEEISKKYDELNRNEPGKKAEFASEELKAKQEFVQTKIVTSPLVNNEKMAVMTKLQGHEEDRGEGAKPILEMLQNEQTGLLDKIERERLTELQKLATLNSPDEIVKSYQEYEKNLIGTPQQINDAKAQFVQSVMNNEVLSKEQKVEALKAIIEHEKSQNQGKSFVEDHLKEMQGKEGVEGVVKQVLDAFKDVLSESQGTSQVAASEKIDTPEKALKSFQKVSAQIYENDENGKKKLEAQTKNVEDNVINNNLLEQSQKSVALGSIADYAKAIGDSNAIEMVNKKRTEVETVQVEKSDRPEIVADASKVKPIEPSFTQNSLKENLENPLKENLEKAAKEVANALSGMISEVSKSDTPEKALESFQAVSAQTYENDENGKKKLEAQTKNVEDNVINNNLLDQSQKSAALVSIADHAKEIGDSDAIEMVNKKRTEVEETVQVQKSNDRPEIVADASMKLNNISTQAQDLANRLRNSFTDLKSILPSKEAVEKEKENVEKQKENLIKKYNSKATVEEKANFVKDELTNDKSLSKDDRLDVVNKLLEQQEENRNAKLSEGKFQGNTKIMAALLDSRGKITAESPSQTPPPSKKVNNPPIR